ncbi:MAG TPA: hypothetical protein PLW73_09560 [Methanoregulaceae archaeon]|nr:hypothetical protein [Methanoregulaceae archaeon]
MLRSSAILMMVLMLAASVAVSSAMITTVPVTEAVPVTLPAPGSEQGYFSINSVPSGGDVYFDSAFWGGNPCCRDGIYNWYSHPYDQDYPSRL